MKRRAAVVRPDGNIETQSEEIPPLKTGQALIRVRASLISPGTEMAMVRSRRAHPLTNDKDTHFGYANAGEILRVNAADSALRPGMRVAAMGAGAAIHASHACVPVNLVAPIPDRLSFDDAAYACLGATALQSVRRTEPRLGEFGAVLGLGIVGNLAAQLYQLSGARVIGWDGLAGRLRIARRCGLKDVVNIRRQDAGAITRDVAAPYGLAFANLAFGGKADDALQSLLPCMQVSEDGHRMGRLVLIGGTQFTMRGGAALGNLDVRSSARTGPGYHDKAYELGRDYPHAFVPFTTQRNLREIIRMMDEKRLRVRPMTTHTVPLTEVNAMADLLIDQPDTTLGVVLTMT